MKSSIYIRVILFIVIIIIWEIIAKFTDPIIFPSFIEVIKSLKHILFQPDTYVMIYHTLYKTFIGVIISMILGVLLGIAASVSNNIYAAIKPFIVVFQSVPVISWILLSLIWLDNKLIPIFVVVISTISIVIINVHEGIKNVDRKLIEMCEIYNVGLAEIIKEVYIPSIVLNLTASIKIIIGLCFKVSVMSEVVASVRSGIGEKLNWAWVNIDTTSVIAWSIIIVILTFIFELLISRVVDKKVEKYI